MKRRRYFKGVSLGVRARLITTGYGRSTTRYSSDASAGGSENAKSTSYPIPTLVRTDAESVETTVRRRKILFSGFVSHMREERLPRKVMVREMLGGKSYSGRREWDWMKDVEEDLKVFGIKLGGLRDAARKVGRWFRRVDEGAEVFMRKWHKDA